MAHFKISIARLRKQIFLCKHTFMYVSTHIKHYCKSTKLCTYVSPGLGMLYLYLKKAYIVINTLLKSNTQDTKYQIFHTQVTSRNKKVLF